MNTHSKALQAARKYTLRGWHVIPIDLRSKRPRIRNWQNLLLEVDELSEHFDEPQNVGVLLGAQSRELVDVDLDCDEAINLASYFLPKTNRIHGRKSKRSSHYWYYAEFPKRMEKFNDIDGTTCLLEVRGTGHQTLVPPSVHPCGERLRWEVKGKVGRVRIKKLSRAVHKLAAATLLARHWPNAGCRNEAALALAGVLLRTGWSAEKASGFIGEVAREGGDEEWKERRRTVVATRRKLSSNLPTTGIPKLNELLGEPLVSKVLEWLNVKEEKANADGGPAARKPKWPKPLTEDAYYGLAGQFVKTIEPHTEADPAALLVQFLTAFGNVVGRKPHFQVEGATHTANLYCLIVGRSAKARKGTAMAHVKRLLERVAVRWARKCIASNLSSGEGLVWAVRDPDLVNDKKEGKRIADTPQHHDKRLLVVQTEFASALRIQRREGNVLSAIVRQAWDSGRLRILTKNSPVETENAHISIIGHITEDELVRELRQTDEANGYANRFLFVCVERTKLLPLGGNVDERELQPIIQQLQRVIFRINKISRMRLTHSAERLWHFTYPRLTADVSGMLGCITARAEAQVLRLSVVYALLDCKSKITRRHLKAALAVWKYCAHSARYIFGGSLGDKHADRILAALREKKRGMTRTEIRELFAGNIDSRKIERALTFLAQNKRANCEKMETNGRPSQIWRAL